MTAKAWWVEIDVSDPEVMKRPGVAEAVTSVATGVRRLEGVGKITLFGNETTVERVKAVMVVWGVPCRGGFVDDVDRTTWSHGNGVADMRCVIGPGGR